MTISSQIIEVLNDLCMKFGLAIDWSQENILPYLQELVGKYISWEVATSWMWIASSVVLILAAIVPYVVERNCEYGEGIGYGVAIAMVFAAFIVIGVQAYDILTCKYFPEKQVFDYIVQIIQEV